MTAGGHTICAILCELNLHYTSSGRVRYDFELQAKKPVLPQCLAELVTWNCGAVN
jgi:hypothetical protein